MIDEVLSCVKTRRSIRKFKEEQIEDSQLDTLLEAAVWAPSGGNSQSWLFTAIQNRDTLHKLNDLLRRTFLTWTPDDEYPSKKKAKVNAQREDHNYFYHAPTLIISSNAPDYPNAMADCALAQQNMFLAATAMGLGSCWINQVSWLSGEAAVREFLVGIGVPANHVVCGSAAIGRPDHQPPAPARKEGTIRIIR